MTSFGRWYFLFSLALLFLSAPSAFASITVSDAVITAPLGSPLSFTPSVTLTSGSTCSPCYVGLSGSSSLSLSDFTGAGITAFVGSNAQIFSHADTRLFYGTPTAGLPYPPTTSILIFRACASSSVCSNTASYTIRITAPEPRVITPTSSQLIQGTLGSSYSQTFTASPTYGTVTWSKTSGAFPTGLSLSSGGVLSGTPTQSGFFTFVVRVSDAQTGVTLTNEQSYTLYIFGGVECWDHSTAATVSACPATTKTCVTNLQTPSGQCKVTCWDGSVVNEGVGCPALPTGPEPGPEGSEAVGIIFEDIDWSVLIAITVALCSVAVAVALAIKAYRYAQQSMK